MPDLKSVPPNLRHLAKTAWDISFLSNRTNASWLHGHLAAHPIAKGETLLDYVAPRLPAHPTSSGPSKSDLPAPVPSAPPSAPTLAIPAASTSFITLDDDDNNPTTGTFGDELDMQSYAAEEPSALDSFVHDADFRQPSLEPYSAAFPPQPAGRTTRTPSPFAAYPGAIAPFAAPGASLFYGAAGAAGSPGPFGRLASPVTSDPTASSSLAATADLIRNGRGGHASPAGASGAIQAWNGYFAPTAGIDSVPPGALFGAPSTAQPTMTITPSIISAPPPPSAAPEVLPRKTPSSSSASSRKPAAASASSAASASKARSASPAVSVSSAPGSSRSKPRPASPAASSYSPEQWLSYLPKVRAQIDGKRLQRSPLSSAEWLVRNLALFTHTDRSSTSSPWGDASDVPPEGRAEVLDAIIAYGKAEFWTAWLDYGSNKKEQSAKGKDKESAASSPAVRSEGLELLQCWLEGAGYLLATPSKERDGASKQTDAKRKELEQASLAYVLKAFIKLPVTMDHLRAYSTVPRLVKRIDHRAPEGSAIKSASSKLMDKWSKLQLMARKEADAPAAASSAAKRKSDTAEGPAKKAKTGTSAASATANDAAKKPAPAAAPPKPALPSFKKTQPSVLSAAMSAITGGKPKPPAPPPPAPAPAAKIASSGAAAASSSGPAADAQRKPGGTARKAAPGTQRKKKKVSWRTEEKLVQIRWIERRAGEDEENADASGHVTLEGESRDDSIQMMQQQEGLSLAMHLDQDDDDDEMEEETEWYEPIGAEIPDTADFEPLREPKQSNEVNVLTERAANAMAVDQAAEPPESPTEPSADEEITPDDEIKRIPLHTELLQDPDVVQTIEDARLSQAPAGLFASNDQISALLGQLSNNNVAQALENAQQPGLTASNNPHQPPVGAGPPGPHAQPPTQQISEETLAMLRSFPAEQVQQLVATQFPGLDLAALGLTQAATQAALAPPAQMPQQGFVPPGFGAQPYGGYVPPSAQAATPPAWAAGGTPDLYNGYQPPGASGAFSHAALSRAFGAPAPAAPTGPKGRRPMMPKRDTPCRFFMQRGRCDWGDKCAFLHER